MNFEQLINGFNKKKYTSVTAEYKRTVHASHSETILHSPSKVWDVLIQDISNNRNIFKGMVIYNYKNKAFIFNYKDQILLSVIFQQKNKNGEKEFIIYEYKLKKLPNGFTRLKYTQTLKREKTITGLNGMLGLIKYKRQIKHKAVNIFENIRKKIK